MRKMRSMISLLLVIAIISASMPTDVLAKTDKTNGETAQQSNTDSGSGGLFGSTDNMPADWGYETEFIIKSQWPGSFNGEIILKNTGTEIIENWALEFEFEHEISKIWNADIIEQEDDKYIIKNKEWNADIEAGAQIRVGFTALWTDAITEPADIVICSKRQDVSSDSFTADFQVSSDWEKGFNGKIAITNNSDQTIEHWTLEFDFDHDITKLWDAKGGTRLNGHLFYLLKAFRSCSPVATGRITQRR